MKEINVYHSARSLNIKKSVCRSSTFHKSTIHRCANVGTATQNQFACERRVRKNIKFKERKNMKKRSVVISFTFYYHIKML